MFQKVEVYCLVTFMFICFSKEAGVGEDDEEKTVESKAMLLMLAGSEHPECVSQLALLIANEHVLSFSGT